MSDSDQPPNQEDYFPEPAVCDACGSEELMWWNTIHVQEGDEPGHTEKAWLCNQCGEAHRRKQTLEQVKIALRGLFEATSNLRKHGCSNEARNPEECEVDAQLEISRKILGMK